MKTRIVLEAIERIFEADGIDDLVGGPAAEGGALYALLLECARGETGRCYDVIQRIAARRRVTPEYLVDRANVLVASAESRLAADLYRVLGVPPLASADEIRDRWRQVVKECHPDRMEGGGSGEQFRELRAAYEVLGDPQKRADYERLWGATLEHIERARVMAANTELEETEEFGQRAGRKIRSLAARVGELLRAADSPVRTERDSEVVAPEVGRPNGSTLAASTLDEGLESVGSGGVRDAGVDDEERRPEPAPRSAPVPETGERSAASLFGTPQADTRSESQSRDRLAPGPGRPEEEPMQDVLRQTDAMFDRMRGIEERLSGAGVGGVGSLARMFEQLHAALDGISLDEIDTTLADVERARRTLDTVGRDLARLRRLKLSLGNAATEG